MVCKNINETLVEDFWENFNDSSKLVEVECEQSLTGGLATDVLNYYDIPYKFGPSGDLASLDIKRMDPLTIIKLSLLEQSAEDGAIYESIVNNDGEVEFIEIADFDGDISDRYYTIQTMQYKEECTGVMVTGAKPRVTRKPVVFKLIWCNDEDKVIYDTSHMHSNCMKEDFGQFATIIFNDPHLDSKFEDGIDNLFELGKENPYDSIIGYVYYKDLPNGKNGKPNLVGDDTIINLVSSCRIPLEIGVNKTNLTQPDVGTLVVPPTYKVDVTKPKPDDEPSCWIGKELEADFKKGVKVEIPDDLRFEDIRGTTVDKFVGISSVYVIGYRLDFLTSSPKANVLKENPTKEDTQIYVTVNNPTKSVTKLTEGRDYAVAYENLEEGSGYKIPYIVFANNARPKDTAEYGQVDSFKIHPSCEAFYDEVQQGENPGEGTGTIIPTDHTTGLLVHQIFVVADIETPAIEIYDPDGENGKALEIAQNLDFYVGALMVEEKPSPVGFNGDTIDMTQSLRDNDPTTVQIFEDTDYEKALDKMQGAGFAINLSFLDGNGDYEESQNQVNNLSKALYDYMNGTGAVSKETIYVCGPDCKPKLGGQTADGIVNEITYSYSDSSAYTISVNAGPKLTGDMAQIDGGPYTKITDNVTLQGTVVQDQGTHVHFKVQIDGFGERLAVNMCKDILRVGDKVNCTIYNCPIEA